MNDRTTPMFQGSSVYTSWLLKTQEALVPYQVFCEVRLFEGRGKGRTLLSGRARICNANELNQLNSTADLPLEVFVVEELISPPLCRGSESRKGRGKCYCSSELKPRLTKRTCSLKGFLGAFFVRIEYTTHP